MSSHALGSPLTPEMNERLRMEIGWTEVGKGLSQILFGYFTIFAGTLVGVGLILIALFGLPDENGRRMRSLGMGSLWTLYIGMAVLVLINLLGYVMVAGGQFRCVMGASERHGARWFMFLSLACMFIGPAVNITAGFAGAQKPVDMNRLQSITEIQYTQSGQYLRLTGFALSLLYPLSFLLFLRAVACCMNNLGLVLVLNVFLLLALGLVGWTGYLIYDPRFMLPQGLVLMGLALGWTGLFLGYLVLIAVSRFCVLRTMERVRSPLEYS